ncbi:MAG TPA: hypothetical protein VGM68_11565 [Rhizomicrobium sp.]|jgi:hypothetical protein
MSEFKPGDYISDNRAGQSFHAVVLAKQQSGELALLWIPEHGCRIVPQTEAQNFEHSAVPDARWVEVYGKDNEEPVFAAYLPTFQAALGVLKWFTDQKAGFKVDIFTANDYEDQLIDEFLNPERARGY